MSETREPRKRRLEKATAIRQRRLALGLSAEALGREAGFKRSKTARIEIAPERARLGDVRLLEVTLARLERTAAGEPDLPDQLAAVVLGEAGPR